MDSLRPKKKKALTVLEKELSKLGDLAFSGTMLAIDPSSGSVGSQPGFAFFREGRLIEAGTIRIVSGDSIHKRLYELRRSLMEDFVTPGLLVTENIPPFMGTGFNKAILNLHYSVGVVLSVFMCPAVRVHPRGWRHHIKDSYIKTDKNDAIMMGYTVLHDTAKLLGVDCPMSLEYVHKLTHSKETP